MPDIQAKFTQLDLDKGTYSLRLRDAIDRQMRLAAREFSKAGAAAVPFRTGFARGVFKNIDEAVGFGSRVAPADPKVRGDPLNSLRIIKKHGSTMYNRKFPEVSGMFRMDKATIKRAGGSMRFEYYTGSGGRVLKTPQSGRQFATSANIIERRSFVWQFNFSTSITYFNINDFFTNARTPSAPWRAFEKGKLAFLNYLRTKGFKKLPQVNNFIYETQVSVSGKTITRTKLGILGRGTRPIE